MPTNEANERELLKNIKTGLPELECLFAESSSHWEYEDRVYRFYHLSFKVFYLQETTEKIVNALRLLLPQRELNPLFMEIVGEGTKRKFSPEDNGRWMSTTRPILEAFFHARYFLEMACRYGKELESPPQILPSGWAAVLCLYGLR